MSSPDTHSSHLVDRLTAQAPFLSPPIPGNSRLLAAIPPGGLVAYPCEVLILPTAPPILTPGLINPEDRFGFIGDIFFPATSTEDCRSLGPAVGAEPEPNLRLELDLDVEI